MRDLITRRNLFGRGAAGAGSLALARLLGDDGGPKPHFAPKAKRLVYLFQSGGPSQLETFDYKPVLQQRNGEELPDSVRQGQRITGMTSGQKSFPVVAPMFEFKKHGEHGTWVSEILPKVAGIVDDIARRPSSSPFKISCEGCRARAYAPRPP